MIQLISFRDILPIQSVSSQLIPMATHTQVISYPCNVVPKALILTLGYVMTWVQVDLVQVSIGYEMARYELS